jgi:hypothetical protein
MPDHIDHPIHYTQGIECIDYIASHNMDYLEGNIIKYVTRYRFKGGVDDLRKAEWYLKRLLKREALGPAVAPDNLWPSPAECAKPLYLYDSTTANAIAVARDWQEEYKQEVIKETAQAMCENSKEFCSNYIKPHKWCAGG